MDNTQTHRPGKKPSHRAYCVIGMGKEAKWNEIGAAWLHADGDGFTIPCCAMPINGQIVLRRIKARTPVEGGQQ